MRANTPPRNDEIEDLSENEDQFEIIAIDNDAPPSPEDFSIEDDELQETTLDDLLNDLQANAQSAPTHDDAELCFKAHKAPVFCCDLHPQLPLAITGGEDDIAYVWQLSNGNILHTITQHTDTVIAAAFNFDGNYCATGDMAGTILVSKVDAHDNEQKINFRQIWDYGMDDLSWMFWHRAANVLLAGSASGEIYIWRIPAGDCKVLPGHSQRCEAADLTADGKKLFASYFDGTLKLWDLKSATVLLNICAEHPLGSTQPIVTVACDNVAPLYLAGGEEKKLIFCTENDAVGVLDTGSAIECVAFSPSEEFKVAACCTLAGELFILDYSKYSIRTKCQIPDFDGNPILRIKWISAYTLLSVNCSGYVHAFDARTGACKFTLSGHLSEIYEMSYDAKENILLTTSEDCTARIFKLPALGD